MQLKESVCSRYAVKQSGYYHLGAIQFCSYLSVIRMYVIDLMLLSA